MRKIIIITLILIPLLAAAQEFNYIFEPDSIPVEVEGWYPFCPWAGGISEANPALVDIDGDGDLDFMIGEYTGYIRFFRNDGSAIEPDFSFISAQFDSIYLEEARNKPCFGDLDNDGDLDLLASDTDAHVHYFENIGTSENPSYILITTDIVPNGPPWCMAPELIDIDADGDLDLFGGWEEITFYRNIGTPDSFEFELITGNFEGISVSQNASVDFIDIDADNDYDLFIGERYGKIWYYRNDGDSVNYDFTFVTDNYEGIDAGSYSSPEFADIDGDGDYDLFVGSYWLYYYENVGSAEAPDFEYVTDSYLTFKPGWFVQVVDINDDDAPDLLVGVENQLSYTENTGTSTDPAFLYIENNFQNISRSAIKPCFVDIDADGDYDLLAGEGVIPGPPTIALYRNIGTPQVPNLILENENFITNDNFFVNVNPVVADIDADGDYDLFVTHDEGTGILFYQNEGTPFDPQYSFETDHWQDLEFYEGWRGFSFGDLDEDEDLDLLVAGGPYYNLMFYRNEGTTIEADMQFETDLFLPGFEIQGIYPYLVDIDRDLDLDLFASDAFGGVSFFRNHNPNVINNNRNIHINSFALLPNYPNPFNASTTIPFTLDQQLPVKVVVYNQLGQVVTTLLNQQLTANCYRLNWNAEGCASGVYLVRLDTQAGFSESRKVILVK